MLIKGVTLQLGYMTGKGMKVLHDLGKHTDHKRINACLCEIFIIFGKEKKMSFPSSSRTPKAQKMEVDLH